MDRRLSLRPGLGLATGLGLAVGIAIAIGLAVRSARGEHRARGYPMPLHWCGTPDAIKPAEAAALDTRMQEVAREAKARWRDPEGERTLQAGDHDASRTASIRLERAMLIAQVDLLEREQRELAADQKSMRHELAKRRSFLLRVIARIDVDEDVRRCPRAGRQDCLQHPQIRQRQYLDARIWFLAEKQARLVGEQRQVAARLLTQAREQLGITCSPERRFADRTGIVCAWP